MRIDGAKGLDEDGNVPTVGEKVGREREIVISEEIANSMNH